MTAVTPPRPDIIGPTGFVAATIQCLTLARRGVDKLRRQPAGLVDVVVGPVIFLVLFGFVFGGAVAGDTAGYLQYIFPGILGVTTLFATLGVGVSLSTDLHDGVFDRFRSLPIVRIAPLAGAIGADLVRQVVSLAALIAFGLLLGVRLEADLWSILAGCAVAVLFAMAVSWVWVLLALVIAEPQAVQGIGALVILPVAFVSTIFVPVDTLPGWMQAVAGANPVGHLVDSVRGLWMGGPVAGPLLATSAWMLAVVLVFAPLSLLVYTRRARA